MLICLPPALKHLTLCNLGRFEDCSKFVHKHKKEGQKNAFFAERHGEKNSQILGQNSQFKRKIEFLCSLSYFAQLFSFEQGF